MYAHIPKRFGHNNNSLRSEIPLTDDQIMKVAPSIFAEDKHESRSTTYTFIPTFEVLKALRAEGYDAFQVAQSNVRDKSRREFTKHLIRLRKQDQVNVREANEVILVNSHDGLSSYQLYTGRYRQICSNGMVRFEESNQIRVPHRGKVVDNVIEGVFRVVEDFELITKEVETMQSIHLSDQEATLLAQSALMLRYNDPAAPAPIHPSQLIQPRRRGDTDPDLWTRFNVVQENVTRGGLMGYNDKHKRVTTRAVTGIAQNLNINAALWHLANEMAKLKS